MGHLDKPATVTLNSEQAAEIEAAVASGEYASGEAVVEEALRDWKERRDNFGYTLDELRRLIQEGIDSGPSLDGAETMERLRERLNARLHPLPQK